MVSSSCKTEHNLILVCFHSKQSPPTECDNFKGKLQCLLTGLNLFAYDKSVLVEYKLK